MSNFELTSGRVYSPALRRRFGQCGVASVLRIGIRQPNNVADRSALIPSSALSTLGDSSAAGIWLRFAASILGVSHLVLLEAPLGVEAAFLDFLRAEPLAPSSGKFSESDADPAEDKDARPTSAPASTSVWILGGRRSTSISARALVLTRSSSDDRRGLSEAEVRALIIASLCTPSVTSCRRAHATLHWMSGSSDSNRAINVDSAFGCFPKLRRKSAPVES